VCLKEEEEGRCSITTFFTPVWIAAKKRKKGEARKGSKKGERIRWSTLIFFPLKERKRKKKKGEKKREEKGKGPAEIVQSVLPKKKRKKVEGKGEKTPFQSRSFWCSRESAEKEKNRGFRVAPRGGRSGEKGGPLFIYLTRGGTDRQARSANRLGWRKARGECRPHAAFPGD